MPFDPSDPTPLSPGDTVEVSNGRGRMASTVVHRKDTLPTDTPDTRYLLRGPKGNEYIRRREAIEAR